jgi:hypothetical protein
MDRCHSSNHWFWQTKIDSFRPSLTWFTKTNSLGATECQSRPFMTFPYFLRLVQRQHFSSVFSEKPADYIQFFFLLLGYSDTHFKVDAKHVLKWVCRVTWPRPENGCDNITTCRFCIEWRGVTFRVSLFKQVTAYICGLYLVSQPCQWLSIGCAHH